MIDGPLKADGRLAAKNATKIRAALTQVTNFKSVFDRYQETQPQPTDDKAKDRARARAWLMLNVGFNNEALHNAIMHAWAEAYVLGQDAAGEWIRKAEKAQKALQDGMINWDTWKPGDRATALLIKPIGGFQRYLEQSGGASYFKKFDKETVEMLGTSLADAIEAGLDSESAALLMKNHVGSPGRALTIAITEQNRAMSFSTIQRYKEAELDKMEWHVSDPCPKCAQNSGQVVEIGQPFKSGNQQPPAHPHCRCVLLPVIPGMEKEPTMADGTPMPSTAGDVVNHAPSGYSLSAGRNKEIENQISQWEKYINVEPGDKRAIEDAVRGFDERNYDKLHNILKSQYQAAGMSKKNAELQASADLMRTSFYIQNQDAALRIPKEYASLTEEGYLDDVKNLKEGIAYASEQTKKAMQNGKITIAINKDNFEKVLQDGAFKNQFQSGQSGGLLDYNIRKVGEGAAINLKVDMPKTDRPIYGFLTTQDKTTLNWRDAKTLDQKWDNILSINNKEVDQYGDLRIILKDTLRDRTTVTIGDSLRTGNLADNITNSDPDLVNMGLHKYGAPSHMAGQPIADYLETQITGGVKIEDIAAVYAPKDQIEIITNLLNDNGITIPVMERR